MNRSPSLKSTVVIGKDTVISCFFMSRTMPKFFLQVMHKMIQSAEIIHAQEMAVTSVAQHTVSSVVISAVFKLSDLHLQ